MIKKDTNKQSVEAKPKLDATANKDLKSW